jgi:hypothetical protein
VTGRAAWRWHRVCSPSQKTKRKWEYFEAARRRIRPGSLISLNLSCILRHSVSPTLTTYISILFPAKNGDPPCPLTSSSTSPSCAIRLSPFPHSFLHRPLTHAAYLLISSFPPAILRPTAENKHASNRFPCLMTVPKTGTDAMSAFDEDDDDHSSDTSSNLTEIGSQEFPSFFVERDNRLFPSHGGPSYPFPVDGHEQNVRLFGSSSLPRFHTCFSSPRSTYSSSDCGSRIKWDSYSE